MLHLSEHDARWGKDKLEVLLREGCWPFRPRKGQLRGLRLFVLPPRSPKHNGCVERAQRTHTEEFYEVTNFSLDVATLNQELQTWELTYNTIRPHQALGYLTPHQFVTQWQRLGKEAKCH